MSGTINIKLAGQFQTGKGKVSHLGEQVEIIKKLKEPSNFELREWSN